jgi:hypothetical protein
MAKIMIYEDSAVDLIDRYVSLTRDHEVHAIYRGRLPGYVRDSLEVEGFKVGEYKDPSQESADVFFLDGMRGACFSILEKLPRDRSFLKTHDSGLEMEALKQGYQVLPYGTTPEEAIQQVLSR